MKTVALLISTQLALAGILGKTALAGSTQTAVAQPTQVAQASPSDLLHSLGSIWFQLGNDVRIEFFPDTLRIGLRLGVRPLDTIIATTPDHSIKDTRYNRITAKWFHVTGLIPNRRELQTKFRVRYQHWEDKPLLGGKILIFDQAADVLAGVNIEVKNNKIESTPRFISAEADWASGVGGWVVSAFDAVFGTVSLVLGSGFHPAFTNALLNISGNWFNFYNIFAQKKFRTEFQQLETLKRSGYIYLSDTAYDDKGVWLMFQVDPNRLNESYNDIARYLRSLTLQEQDFN